MVIFDKKIVSNSEANYISIEGKVFNKKDLSNQINNFEGDLIILDDTEIQVVRKINKNKNYILLDGKEFCLDHSQSSYNLEKRFYKYALEKGILIENPHIEHARKDKDGNAYVLNEDYKFELGPGVLSIIGQGYSNLENKFITSLNKSNCKFQIYRDVYRQKENNNEEGYGWFIELFDNNIVGSRLIIDIEEELKIFTFDINLEEIL